MRITTPYIEKSAKNFSKLDNFVFLASSLIVALVVIAQVLEFESVVSLLFLFSLVLTFGVYFLKTLAHRKINLWLLFAIVMLLLSVCRSLKTDFDYYKNAIIAICILLTFTQTSKAQISLKQRSFCVSLSVFVVLALNIFFHIGGLKNEKFGRTTSVSLNFDNPNIAALWLTCFFILLLTSFFVYKKRYVKVIILISAFSLIPMIWETESRNPIISCAFMLLGVISVHFFKLRKIPKWISIMLILLPLVVFFFYVYVYIPNISTFDFLSFLDSDTKFMTSRQDIWETAQKDLGNLLFLGDYEKYNEFGQMHNSLISLFCMYGLPFMIATCVIFYTAIKNMPLMSQIAMLAIWVTGCFETSIFTGAAGMYLMVYLIPNIPTKSKDAIISK